MDAEEEDDFITRIRTQNINDFKNSEDDQLWDNLADLDAELLGFKHDDVIEPVSPVAVSRGYF